MGCIPFLSPPQGHVPLPVDAVHVAITLPHTMVVRSSHSYTCPLTFEQVSQLAHEAGVRIRGTEGQGSQGRVFTLHNSDQVMKLSVTRTPENREQHNYSRLSAIGIPCARTSVALTNKLDDTTFAHVLLLERLPFTLTAIIRACAMTSACCIVPSLFRACTFLLQTLRRYKLTYVDLSPDNIMLRHVRKNVYQLVLIDPSYMTSDSACTDRNFDRLYLGYKIMLLALLHPSCQSVATQLGTQLLGFEPTEKQIVHWLQTVPPVAIRCVSTIND